MSKRIALYLTTADPIAAAVNYPDKLAVAEALIDRRAVAARQAFVANGVQAAIYQEKAAEAAAAQAVIDAAGTPAPEDYPHLNAEVGVTGPDIAAVATSVLAKRNYWLGVASPAIEGARIQAKADAATAAAAEDEAAIRAAVLTDMTPPAP